MWVVRCDICGTLIQVVSKEIAQRRLQWHWRTIPDHRTTSRLEEVV